MPYRRQGTDEPALVCVLIEHQTAPDVRMPLRLLVYTVLYWERLWKAWEDSPPPRGPLRLTPSCRSSSTRVPLPGVRNVNCST